MSILWRSVRRRSSAPSIRAFARAVVWIAIGAGSGIQAGAQDMFEVSAYGPVGNTAYEATAPDVAYNPRDDEFLVAWIATFDDQSSIFAQRYARDGTALSGKQELFPAALSAPGDPFEATAIALAFEPCADDACTTGWFWLAINGYDFSANEHYVVALTVDPTSLVATYAGNVQTIFDEATFNQLDVALDVTVDTTHLCSDAQVFTCSRVLFSFLSQPSLGSRGLPTSSENRTWLWERKVGFTGDSFAPQTPSPHLLSENLSILGIEAAHSVVADEYMVVFEGPDGDGTREIFGQRIDNDGELVGDTVKISNHGPPGEGAFSVRDPSIVYDRRANRYLVSWTGSFDLLAPFDAPQWEVFRRLIMVNGTGINPNGLITSDMGGLMNTTYRPRWVASAYDEGRGEFLVVWDSDDWDDGQIDDEHEVFVQRIDAASGGQVGQNDQRLSMMGGLGNTTYQARRAAVASGRGASLIVWQGDHNANGHVDDETEVWAALLGIFADGFESGDVSMW